MTFGKLTALAAILASSLVSDAWQPPTDSMLTEWSEQLSPKSARMEYPCPGLVREIWTNLNGHEQPFQIRDGKWWCTALFNGKVPPLPRQDLTCRRNPATEFPWIRLKPHQLALS